MNKKLIYIAAVLISVVAVLPMSASAQIMPVISNVSPNIIATGTGTMVITISGSNYVNGSWVNVNGNARSTAYISSNQLTVALLSSDIANSGTLFVSVSNPAWVSGSIETSNVAAITVNGNSTQAVGITSVSPNSVFAGSQTLAMTVNGYGFMGGSVVKFNGLSLFTTYVNSTQLLATVPASYLTNTGMNIVRVENPGGMTSGGVYFNVAAMTVPGLPETGAGPVSQNNGAQNTGAIALGVLATLALFSGTLVYARKRYAK